MKITHAKLSSPIGRGKRLVTVCAELGSPNEYMTITVAVLNDGSEQDIRERGIARALEYARQLATHPRRAFRPTSRGPNGW